MGLDKKKGTKPGTRPGTKPATKQGTKQGLLLLAAAGGLLAIVVLGIIVIVALRSRSSPGASDGAPVPKLGTEGGTRTAAERRLVLEEWPSDEEARGDAFRRLLKDEGHKCNEVEKAAMVSAGVWTVRCATGNVYRLAFNEKARLKEITKLQ